MILEAEISQDENIDDLTVASAIICFCNDNQYLLDPVKIAKAILIEVDGDDNA